ncbi:MAG: Ig-like domain-containing protein, partial [Patescibacteria group bacterium]
TSTADFSPSLETLTARDIHFDKRMVPMVAPPLPSTSTTTQSPVATSTTPATTSTTPFSFTSSHATVQGGDVVTLLAYYSGGDAISKIEILFDGTLVKSCGAISCSADALIPTSGSRSSYVAEARVTKLSTGILSNTLTLTVQANESSLVSIRVGQSMVLSGQQASAIATADASIAINRIDIFVDGILVKGCTGGTRQCQWSDALIGAHGSSHAVFAKVLDNFGRTYSSKTVTITIGANDLPGIAVATAKSTIYTGETVDVTVSATDNDGISWIEVMKDGVVLKRCDGAAPCTTTTGPWNTGGSVLAFSGRASDTKGNMGTASESATVSVSSRER